MRSSCSILARWQRS
ncbi:hypothetical protein E2C01_074037 [Portunus trituberculatus]|uniref:Uncharacterized protein n=1 Tax=Portunus trituberculatus TaxID=210409 RepID=A0A5B7IFA0_PORTR|nr:hypothetical protein [Portunus trituberculatus]